MDGGEDLLSNSHNFPYVRQIHVCMDAISQESNSRYFDLLESTLKEHQLEDCPGQTYNMDETRPPNIIAKSGQKE